MRFFIAGRLAGTLAGVALFGWLLAVPDQR